MREASRGRSAAVGVCGTGHGNHHCCFCTGKRASRGRAVVTGLLPVVGGCYGGKLSGSFRWITAGNVRVISDMWSIRAAARGAPRPVAGRCTRRIPGPGAGPARPPGGTRHGSHRRWRRSWRRRPAPGRACRPVSAGLLCADGAADERADGGDGRPEEGGGAGFVVEFGKHLDETEGRLAEQAERGEGGGHASCRHGLPCSTRSTPTRVAPESSVCKVMMPAIRWPSPPSWRVST